MTTLHLYETNQIQFLDKLEQLRTTKEQIYLQKQAANKSTKSNLVTLLLAIAIASMVVITFLKAHWTVFIGAGVFAFYLYMLSKRLTLESLILAKE